MLTIKGLKKSYKIGNESIPVLKGVSLDIEAGSFVALVGPSGCGKSTLLNLLGGLDKADEGEIEFAGVDISQFDESQLERYRLENIGTIFQSFNLIAHFTALENVEVPMTLAGIGKAERRKKAEELLRLVGLEDRSDHKPNQLSGGQKQRVAIARALALEPTILLADEPTGALDTKTGEQILQLMKEIVKQKGTTIIMVTHSLEIAEQADHIIGMRDGEIIEEEVKSKENQTANVSAPKTNKGNMSIGTSIRHAIGNLKQKKWRTLLVSVGASIGICGIALMVGLGMGLEKRIQQEFESIISQDVLTVYLDEAHKKPLAGEAMKKVQDMPEVKAVVQNYHFMTGFMYGDLTATEDIFSLPPDQYIDTLHAKEDLIAGDLPKSDKEIAISESLAEGFVGERKAPEMIGKEVTAFMQNRSPGETVSKTAERKFVVTGIRKKEFIGFSTSVIDYDLAQALSKANSVKNEKQVAYTDVVVKDVDQVDQVRSKLEGMGLFVSADSEILAKIRTYSTMVQVGLGMFAGISLVVSSIMIGIVLYISVLERTREIGVLRAIGARRKDIRRIFLTEATVLGVVAGIIGVLFAGLWGMIGNEVIRVFLEKNAFSAFILPSGLALFCVLFSAILSLLAGWLPAYRATKLNPIDALRHE